MITVEYIYSVLLYLLLMDASDCTTVQDIQDCTSLIFGTRCSDSESCLSPADLTKYDIADDLE